LFFLFLLLLLRIQAFASVSDPQAVSSSLGRAVAVFFVYQAFVVDKIAFVAFPLLVVPLICLVVRRSRSRTWRRYLDAV